MSHRPLIRLLGKTDLRLRFETRPVYRTFLTCACVVNTCTHNGPTSILPRRLLFIYPISSFVYSGGVPSLSSFLFFLSDSSQSSFPTESSTASRLAHRAESNSLVTLVGVPSRGPTNGINGQSGWQVKFSPEFNSMAPLNSR